MVVHLRVQRPLRQRPLQLVDQAIPAKGSLRITPSKELVQQFVRDDRCFAACHARVPSFPSSWLTHEIPDRPCHVGALVEHSFALVLARGGMRRSRRCGRESLHRRSLVPVAGYNPGLVMRLLVGSGPPWQDQAPISVHLLTVTAAHTLTAGGRAAMLIVRLETEPHG
jgi:hypothetical protein